MNERHLLVLQVSTAHTQRHFLRGVNAMKWLRKLCLVHMLLGLPLPALAAQGMVAWPEGWVVDALPDPGDEAPQRERATHKDANGDPQLVMEITRSRLQPGHVVNLQGVLLEMRKAVQQNFAREGFQSVCTHVRDTRLSELPAVETTCTVAQNGVHVMTQTLVAAVSQDHAWSMSYAGSAQGYEAGKDEVQHIRDSLRLQTEQ